MPGFFTSDDQTTEFPHQWRRCLALDQRAGAALVILVWSWTQLFRLSASMARNHGKEQPQPTVVIVDDDPAVRNSLKFSLELEGFAVRLYADGGELLADLDLPANGCLVIDQVMPGTSGLDLVDVLRKRGISNPAVLVVSDSNPRVRRRAAVAGIAVIEKPFFGNTLVDAIRDCLL